MKGVRLAIFAPVMLLAVGSGIALAEQGERSEPDPALSAPSGPGTEIVTYRTANSETFRLSDGERETRVYGEPVNHEESGEWQPIGDAGRESVDGAALTNGENDFEIGLLNGVRSVPMSDSVPPPPTPAEGPAGITSVTGTG